LRTMTQEKGIRSAQKERRVIQTGRMGTVCVMLLFPAVISGGCAITPRIGLIPLAKTIGYSENHDNVVTYDNGRNDRAWLAAAPAVQRTDGLELAGGGPNTNFTRRTRWAGASQTTPSRLSLRQTAHTLTPVAPPRSTAWLEQLDPIIGRVGGSGNLGTWVRIRRPILDESIALTLDGDPPTGHSAGKAPARNLARSSVIAVTHQRP